MEHLERSTCLFIVLYALQLVAMLSREIKLIQLACTLYCCARRVINANGSVPVICSVAVRRVRCIRTWLWRVSIRIGQFKYFSQALNVERFR
jgi:hypothetical protein